ncbi:MAG: hypothetical protein KatS3mg115_2449 [Candidatus Poribacteria bacterium]|nr:MAG: hypothetical protein KatS3mg115_2449 [Candidatus Poribacteria bacterium]
MRRSVSPSDDLNLGLSIGDLMAALLLIFVLVLATALMELQKEFRERAAEAVVIKQTVETYKQVQDDLYEALYDEFKDDLVIWNAELERSTLIFRFKEPEVLFEVGKATLRPRFTRILDDFFPRYVRTLRDPRFRDRISEVRLEGHTSPEWLGTSTPEEAYFENMRLSQDRTRAVLQYVLGTIGPGEERDWCLEKIAAIGLSSSRPPRDSNRRVVDDYTRWRRVEFRVMLDLAERLASQETVAVGRGSGE